MAASRVLLDPVRAGDLVLPNRIVMAPMARSRADRLTAAPTAPMATYYAQRADAGLIITEATAVSRLGHNYFRSPGIYSDEQERGWRSVVEAVHAAGGRIVAQLVHAGRATHTSIVGDDPVAPSPLGMLTKTLTKDGFRAGSAPRTLEIDEIAAVVREYGDASRRAHAAGFDGVEVHGANGYLLDQFLKRSSNQRTDRYGGAPSNRARLLVDVLAAVLAHWPERRVGLRISPGPAQDAFDPDPMDLFGEVVGHIDTLPLAYVHAVRGIAGGATELAEVDLPALRHAYSGTWIVNNGYTLETAEAAVAGGECDLVAFGRPFIANPDLVERYRRGQALAEATKDGVYGPPIGQPDTVGYTDQLPFPPARLREG